MDVHPKYSKIGFDTSPFDHICLQNPRVSVSWMLQVCWSVLVCGSWHWTPDKKWCLGAALGHHLDLFATAGCSDCKDHWHPKSHEREGQGARPRETRPAALVAQNQSAQSTQPVPWDASLHHRCTHHIIAVIAVSALFPFDRHVFYFVENPIPKNLHFDRIWT